MIFFIVILFKPKGLMSFCKIFILKHKIWYAAKNGLSDNEGIVMNHEHHIVAFWRASLNFFTCEQLGMFAKLTLNAYRITLKTLLRQLGWIFVVWFGLIHWPAFMNGFLGALAKLETNAAMQVIMVTMNICSPVVIFFIIIAARSSIMRKHWYYFMTKTIRFFIPFLVVTALLGFVFNYGMSLLHAPAWLWVIAGLHVGLYMILFGFFYVDMKSMLAGLISAARMMLYTYPVMVIMCLVAYALSFICGIPVGFLSVVLSNMALLHWMSALIFWLFGSTMLVVMMSNIYIKHVYEYNKIYCPVP
jgi:uncharacterized membrane protein